MVADEGGCGGGVGCGAVVAAGEVVGGAVGGGDGGSGRGEDVEPGVDLAGRIALGGGRAEHDAVCPGQDAADAEPGQGGLQVGQEQQPAGGVGAGEYRVGWLSAGGVGRHGSRCPFLLRCRLGC